MELTAKDVVAIIKACGESGVTQFSFGQLYLTFESQIEKFHVKPTVESDESNSYQVQPEQVEEKPQMMGEMDREELKVQMLIDDPLALEEMVMRGDNHN